MGRGIRCRQSELTRELPDFGLRQSGLLQRSNDRELGRRHGSGPQVGRIVGILSVGDGHKPSLLGDLIHPAEKLRLAEVAAVHRVLRIAGIFQLGGGNHFDRGAD